MSNTRTLPSGAVLAVPGTAATASAGWGAVRNSIRVSAITGICSAGSVYLQFFTTTINATTGAPAAPTASQVPLLSVPVNTAIAFNYLYNSGLPLIPGPVWIGVSSTQGTYTASAVTFTGWIEVEEWEEEVPSTITSVSSSSTGLLQVWTNAQAPHNLYDVFVNNSGNACWLMLFASDAAPATGTPAPGSDCVWAVPASAGTGIGINLVGSLLLNFGNAQEGGQLEAQQGGLLNTGGATSSLALATPLEGCYLALSSTATTYTPYAPTCKMVARYV